MAAFEYRYASPVGLHKVAADVVGKVCEELERSELGLTPSSLLDYSRDENSPTHREFEWNDEIAGEKYRLEQARKLIIDLRVVHDDVGREDARERAFVVTSDRKSEYVPIQKALSNEEWRTGLLAQARKDSEIFLAKYRRLEELANVNAAMEVFVSSIEKAS